MKKVLLQRDFSVLQELPDELRKTIIQNLWKETSELPSELEDLPLEYTDMLQNIFTECRENPEVIPELRYELETYTNDLDPEFSEKFIEENQWKFVRILDIGTGPWDVTLRSYKKLVWAWIIPQIFAFERSQRFRSELVKRSLSEWIVAQEREKILWIESYSWIFPIGGDIEDLWRQVLLWVQLVTWNYVLDRIPQRQLMKDIEWIANIQFINCIPLQYQNPNTWQSYILESEIIISPGASDISEIWNVLNLKNSETFFWTNTVTSLQDGEEVFRYAWIRGQLNT